MSITPDDLINEKLIEDSEIYKELGYCITPEEHIKEANEELLRLRSINQELLAACEYVVKYHREHDSGAGELYGQDFVTTCISAINKAKGFSQPGTKKMEAKVYYLPSDCVGEIVSGISDNEFEEEVKAHPETLIYSLSDFQEAFNLEEISDLGYIVIDEEIEVSEGNHNDNNESPYGQD